MGSYVSPPTPAAAGAPDLIIQDQKAAGSDGGSCSATTSATRDLNTVVRNEIAGASLASNQITLPAGDYYIEFDCPAYQAILAQAWIYNVTDAAVELNGSGGHTDVGSGIQCDSHGAGVVSLAAEKDLELRMYTHGGKIPDGFGYALADFASNGADGEVYSTVRVWKL